MEHVYKVNKIIKSIFYLCAHFPLSRCFTSFCPDHLPAQGVGQEKAIDSGYRFKQSSAAPGSCELQVNQLPETQGADKLEISLPLTPRKKTHHFMCFVLYIINSKSVTGSSLYNC